jgi:transcriptional regulator with XRE-family HTH domain
LQVQERITPETDRPPGTEWKESARCAVGRFLRSRREALGLSQEQIAALSGDTPWKLTRAGISSIERGNNFPGLEALLVYLSIVDVLPAEVLEVARNAGAATGDDGLAKAHRAVTARRFPEAQSIYRSLLHAGRGAPARRRAHLHLRLSSALEGCCSPLGAEEAALAAARTGDLPEIRVEAWVRHSGLRLSRGLTGSALDSASRALRISGDTAAPVRASALLAHGRALLQAGAPERSRTSLLAARKIFREHRYRWGKNEATGEIGRCLARMGRIRDARRWVRAVIRSARRHRLVDQEGHWLVELARICLDDGEKEEAGALALACMRLGRIHSRPLLSFRAGWIRYLISREGNSGGEDRRVLALLSRLYPHLEGKRHVRELREFREQMTPGLFSETPRSE